MNMTAMKGSECCIFKICDIGDDRIR